LPFLLTLGPPIYPPRKVQFLECANSKNPNFQAQVSLQGSCQFFHRVLWAKGVAFTILKSFAFGSRTLGKTHSMVFTLGKRTIYFRFPAILLSKIGQFAFLHSKIFYWIPKFFFFCLPAYYFVFKTGEYLGPSGISWNPFRLIPQLNRFAIFPPFGWGKCWGVKFPKWIFFLKTIGQI